MILCPSTPSAVAGIPVNLAEPVGVAVSPDGKKVYVADKAGKAVAVIDAESMLATNSISVGGAEPIDVVATPDGTKVYVLCTLQFSIKVIDAASETVLPAEIPLSTQPATQPPAGLAMHPDGSTVYATYGGLAGSNFSGICVVDTELDISTGRIDLSPATPVGASPTALVVTPDGRRLYVALTTQSSVAVIDTTTKAIIKVIPTGIAQPTGIAINAAGTKVYAPSRDSGGVSVIDTATNAITKTVRSSLLNDPVGVAVANGAVYVANYGNGSGSNVAVISEATLTVGSTLGAGLGPTGVAASPDGTHVYVTNREGGDVTRISAVRGAGILDSTVRPDTLEAIEPG